jgi:hypothetical protein
VVVEGVDVGLDCAGEESGVLGDYGNVVSEVVEAQLGGVFFVEFDEASRTVFVLG